MKYLLFLPLTLGFLTICSGQATKIETGLHFGINMSQIDGDNSIGYNKIGMNAGIRGSYILNRKSRVNLDIEYSSRGSRPTKNEIQFDPIALNYIAIPITFQYNDWLFEDLNGNEFYKVYALGGVNPGRLINSDTAVDSVNFFNTWNLSFEIGAGYHLTHRIIMEAKYQHSLNELVLGNSDLYRMRFLTFALHYKL